MYHISKQFEFSASHILEGLPEGHQCGRLHGHNYIVVVELGAPDLDVHGFVRDYAELSAVKAFIDELWDHRHLNDWFGEQNATAENMARALYALFIGDFPELLEVRVSETPKTWAVYRP